MQTEFSERLKKYRENAGLSAQRLASLTGAGEKSVAAWESGEAFPDEAQTALLCRVYGVTAEQLKYLDPDELISEPSPAPAVQKAPPAAEETPGSGRFSSRDRMGKYVRALPLVLAAAAAYLALGFAFGWWHPAWILFMCVPVVYSAFQAVSARSVRKFNYPVLITAVYLFVGFVFGAWHPAWLILLTIPLFYVVF